LFVGQFLLENIVRVENDVSTKTFAIASLEQQHGDDDNMCIITSILVDAAANGILCQSISAPVQRYVFLFGSDLHITGPPLLRI